MALSAWGSRHLEEKGGNIPCAFLPTLPCYKATQYSRLPRLGQWAQLQGPRTYTWSNLLACDTRVASCSGHCGSKCVVTASYVPLLSPPLSLPLWPLTDKIQVKSWNTDHDFWSGSNQITQGFNETPSHKPRGRLTRLSNVGWMTAGWTHQGLFRPDLWTGPGCSQCLFLHQNSKTVPRESFDSRPLLQPFFKRHHWQWRRLVSSVQ